MSGWLKIWRKIRDSRIWNTEEPFEPRSAWVDLLLRAAHKTERLPVGYQWREVHAGQILTSQRKLAAAWKWSRPKVARFLAFLEADDMITIETDRTIEKGGTLITVIHWPDYQTTDPDSFADETFYRPTNRATSVTTEPEENKGDRQDRDPRTEPRALPRPSHERAASVHIQEEQEESLSLSSTKSGSDQEIDYLEEALKRGGLNREPHELEELRVELSGLLEVYNTTQRDARTVTPRLLSAYANVRDHWGPDGVWRGLDAVHGLLCDPEQWALKKGLALDHVFRDVETAERYAFFGKDRWETSQAKATYEREKLRAEKKREQEAHRG